MTHRIAILSAFFVNGCVYVDAGDLSRRIGMLEAQQQAVTVWTETVVAQGNDQEMRLKVLEAKP